MFPFQAAAAAMAFAANVAAPPPPYAYGWAPPPPPPMYAPAPVYAAPPPAYYVPPPPPVFDATVAWVQQALNVLMHANLAVDGIAGPATFDAVAAFQAANRINPDGVTGPATVAVITGQLRAAASLLPPAPRG